jgi:hypothetical protein
MASADHAATLGAKSCRLDEMIRSGKDGTVTMHRFNSEQQ